MRKYAEWVFSIVLLAAVVVSAAGKCEGARVPSDKIILGYFQDDSLFRWKVSEIDFSCLTHVAHAFMRVQEGGSLDQRRIVGPGTLDKYNFL